MSELEQELLSILSRLRIDGADRFQFDGTDYRCSAPPPQPAAGVNYLRPPAEPLVNDLLGLLYSRCYTRAAAPAMVQNDPAFLASLQAANQGVEHWDSGWRVYQQAEGGRLFVQKGERHRAAQPGEYLFATRPGHPPQLNDVVSLWASNGSPALQDGFFHVIGEELADQFDEFSILRFYFNVTADAAPALVAFITDALNRYRVPFRFKCLSAAGNYGRADGAVLYVANREFDLCAQLLEEMPEAVTAGLRPEVPLFSQELRPGVGLAEDPGNGESFGMHRCRLLAEGLVAAWRESIQDDEGRLERVRRHFADNGVQFARCHLNPESVDRYHRPAPLEIAV